MATGTRGAQILAFVNAYLLQSDGGQLLVWAVGDGAR